ncbi:uncharacterized protein M6B38_381550 [Iris pallida]|uniref:Elongation factor Ts, mitochondrial n=1 Tax=Iris pallida TaxID=29817 RepID=A0AAX6G7J3_IRIPA|nr:uncharacterized protein M6B38_381550 [Iris pallida]
MTPIVHCSAGNIHFFPGTTFIQQKEIQLTKRNVPVCYARLTSSSQRFLLPRSSIRPFQIYRSISPCKHRSGIRSLAATETDVTIPNPVVSGEDADQTSEAPPTSVETSESATVNTVVTPPKNKRPRPARRSDMPPVKNDDLTPGSSFTGKVRSVQPFGAFVDFGAFTDGLVHVSRMSDGFVKDVADVVSVGQEVKVRIVEANMETGRISLTMRDGDDASKRRESPAGGSSDRPRPSRKNAAGSSQKRAEGQKSSKFTKGQVLDGTVKNLTRSGAFVSLPDGEEGFIPASEESEGFGNIIGNSSLQVGQEVNVRVLRITRGRVTLTMKKEEDMEGLNRQLNQGVVHVATNAFELAFRKNKDIASFLVEREKAQASEEISLPKTSEQTGVEVDGNTSASDVVALDGSTTSTELLEEKPVVESISSEQAIYDKEPVSESSQSDNSVLETLSEGNDSSGTLTEPLSEPAVDEAPLSVDSVDSSASVETEPLISEGNSADSVSDETPVTNEVTDADSKTKSVEETNEVLSSAETVASDDTAGQADEKILSSEVEASEEVDSTQADVSVVSEKLETESPVLVENETVASDDTAGQADEKILLSEVEASEEVDSTQADISVVSEKLETESPVLVENETSSPETKDLKLEVPEATNGQTGIPDEPSVVKAAISPALVKQLREETGAGMMDCKKALSETDGDIVKAQEFLRKKGLASADKKASRATAEGRIGSYIHDSRIGVLIEVNCETDFVSRGEIFKQLVDDLAMQVAAYPQVRYLVPEDVPAEIVDKEREIEMQKEDLLAKPEQIRSKIVEGRIRKRLEEFALLEQPYIKNDKIAVKDWVKQTIATIGENIRVNRFVRYNLGEGLEKKNQDFAAEVAAQTAAKESPAAATSQPTETKETVEKPPAVAVSAAMVKQLREESGAGMMDCKKALKETGGDLEKAQEYLRKKGLSSADKKSSRLAAEGRISSYIHDARIGVLIEVNSETDFVGRNEKFKELVDDLAMQVVACPQVEYVSVEDIPEAIVNKEKELEMQREDLKSKPENIRERIVEGRISKRLGELALLEQLFVKDDSILVKDLVKQTVAALGENIKVRRFVRFTLGETTG